MLLIFFLSWVSFLLFAISAPSELPFWNRYVDFMMYFFHEFNFFNQESASTLGCIVFLPTILLFLSTVFCSGLIGFALGFIVGLFKNKVINGIFHFIFLFFYSVPIIFLGLIVFIQISPTSFNYLISMENYHHSDVFYLATRHDFFYVYFLPVFILSIQSIAMTTHIVSRNVQSTLNLKFMKLSQIQNLSYFALIIRHLIPNVVPYSVNQLLNYASITLFLTMVVELILNLNGIGKFVYQAFLAQETLDLALTILFSGAFIGLFCFICQCVLLIVFPFQRRK